MWTETRKPYMWDVLVHLPPDVRPVAVLGTSSPCGENRNKFSTRYPQEEADSNPIYILGKLQPRAQIWGHGFNEIPYLDATSPQGEALIHR